MIKHCESMGPGQNQTCDPRICTLQLDIYLQSDNLPTVLRSQVLLPFDKTLHITRIIDFN